MAQTTSQAYVAVVHPTLPVKSVSDMISLAKAKPGSLNFASSGAAGGQHLVVELFKMMSGTNLVHVPYQGTAPASKRNDRAQKLLDPMAADFAGRHASSKDIG